MQDPVTAAKKTSLVDILCKDEKGNRYIVEMQVAKEKGFEKRAQYYASKAYITQAANGGTYQDLNKVIFLAISDFVMFPQKKEYKSDHVILDKKSHENDLKDFSLTFLELPKFNKDPDFFQKDNKQFSNDLPKTNGSKSNGLPGGGNGNGAGGVSVAIDANVDIEAGGNEA